MPWPPREIHISKRFKDFDDLALSLKNPTNLLAEDLHMILDALLFLAEEIQKTKEALEILENESIGYDP